MGLRWTPTCGHPRLGGSLALPTSRLFQRNPKNRRPDPFPCERIVSVQFPHGDLATEAIWLVLLAHLKQYGCHQGDDSLVPHRNWGRIPVNLPHAVRRGPILITSREFRGQGLFSMCRICDLIGQKNAGSVRPRSSQPLYRRHTLACFSHHEIKTRSVSEGDVTSWRHFPRYLKRGGARQLQNPVTSSGAPALWRVAATMVPTVFDVPPHGATTCVPAYASAATRLRFVGCSTRTVG